MSHKDHTPELGATNGIATLDGTTRVPVVQLPVMVGSGPSNAAGIVPAPGAVAGTTKFLREDATWQVPSGSGLPPATEATSTTTTTTNTATDTLISGMTLTPGAGNFLAHFTASADVNNANRVLYVSIYVGGSQIAASEIRISGTTATVPVAITKKVSPTGGQAVEVRWRLSSTGGSPTGTMYNRVLTLLQVQ